MLFEGMPVHVSWHVMSLTVCVCVYVYIHQHAMYVHIMSSSAPDVDIQAKTCLSSGCQRWNAECHR